MVTSGMKPVGGGRCSGGKISKSPIQKYFEEKYLDGTCFDSLEDLLADKTDFQINVVRAFIAVDLCGVWKGLNDKFMRG